ncbi:MAG TPA: amidohydrolase family protein, partial [Bryobacteraceae bacterium]|nr:amidohydrolase family protein [Bryobacteraceae bacterium]
FPALLLGQQQGQNAQGPPIPAPTIEEYDPKPMLVVPKTTVSRAKFPFIDIHTHQRDLSPAKLDQLIKDMDSLNMRIMVSSPVNGSFGQRTQAAITAIKAYPAAKRFATMTNIDMSNPDAPDYSTRAAATLEQDIQNGAIGLKVWKNFGLTEKDSKGQRIKIDDPRFDAVWKVCAKYKVPVLIHTADPKPLFDPMDKDNERWLELKMRPNRQRNPSEPSWETLIQEQHNLFAKNPQTTFINAHMGWMAHDLGALGKLLDRLPNVNLEFAAILGELGRQPRSTKQFFIKYQDRILFGKDTYNVAEYGFYFRLLETADEYIDNIRRYHGLWKLYAFDLPDDVLKKVYYKNALRLFPTLNGDGFPR